MSFFWRPKIMLFAVTIVSLNGPSPAQPQYGSSDSSDVHPRSCAYFQQAGFQGERREILEHEDLDVMDQDWDDQISSVQCASRCHLVAYDRSFYSGPHTSLSGSVPELDSEWNDHISSMAVNCNKRNNPDVVIPVR